MSLEVGGGANEEAEAEKDQPVRNKESGVTKAAADQRLLVLYSSSSSVLCRFLPFYFSILCTSLFRPLIPLSFSFGTSFIVVAFLACFPFAFQVPHCTSFSLLRHFLCDED